MGNRARQLNVPHTLTTHLSQRNFDTAFLANDTTMLKALVLTAQAFVVLYWAKNFGTEQAVTLGLEGTIVDCFRFLDLTIGPRTDHCRRSETDTNCIKVFALFPA